MTTDGEPEPIELASDPTAARERQEVKLEQVNEVDEVMR